MINTSIEINRILISKPFERTVANCQVYLVIYKYRHWLNILRIILSLVNMERRMGKIPYRCFTRSLSMNTTELSIKLIYLVESIRRKEVMSLHMESLDPSFSFL